MPGGDGTGPWWAHGRGWRCRRPFGFGRGFGYRYWQRYNEMDFPLMSKQDEKEFLEEELKQIEAEKNALEKKLKEIGL